MGFRPQVDDLMNDPYVNQPFNYHSINQEYETYQQKYQSHTEQSNQSVSNPTFNRLAHYIPVNRPVY